MIISFYRTSIDFFFCVLEIIFVNIPKIVILVLHKKSEEYF